MAEERGAGAEPVVLFASRWWPAVLVPLGLLAVAVAIGVRLHAASLIVFIGTTAATVVSAWLHRDGALLADATGLLVRHRGTVTRSYRWSEIHQAGLARPGFGRLALAVYPDGGRWDVPGPNSAVMVGQVWLWRQPDPESRERIEAALRDHGVRVVDPLA
ncbi:hypothetical protein O7602_06310 [Micromonospora sp. WMMD1128]|uniref:hypothetical protein n=1 Tax=Micromonospora sp. WMMD1128 TaxID=3015150 RepID=UPI00248CCEC1|nr:hypothetical protein [Micromonospora sp. WMMD1128]WBB75136.1 hypothetical protein O7602_06310 [Micromonospora sp. WMMD1128]